MQIKHFITGPIRTNTFIIWDKETKDAAIIDPAGKEKEIKKFVKDNCLKVMYIINTHGHFDHILLNKRLSKYFNADILIHKDDKDLLTDNYLNTAEICNLSVEPSKPGNLLNNKDIILIGRIKLEVIHTPGHSKGSICLHNKHKNILFSGDSLFSGGIGRTDLPRSSYDYMLKSIKRLKRIPQETRVYPGHGPETTIKKEYYMINSLL